MDVTRLSSKGQIIIPGNVRQRRRWQPGQEFDVVETEEGVLLRPRQPFASTQIEDVAGSLKWREAPVPVEQLGMEALPYQDPYGDDRD